MSALLNAMNERLPGRLLVFFPGEHEGNSYRLLDARDGWNYLATPITPNRSRQMTITNRELFYRDPTDTKIPNDGVAKVLRPETEQQWDVLKWELKSFVCEGEYARGLERILDSFLTNLSQAQQPAVWVSGFYGSGKSHLVRVLEYLWRDTELPGGESARSLVTPPRRCSRPPHRAIDGRQAPGRSLVCSRHARPRGRAKLSALLSYRCFSRAPGCQSSIRSPASSSGRRRMVISTRWRRPRGGGKVARQGGSRPLCLQP